MTDSSTGGVLLPTANPINDVDLDVVFQGLVSALTGLHGQYVRPRFQGEPAAPPDFGSTWAAVGVTAFDDDQYPVQQFKNGTGLILIRNERLDVMCSFYGAKAQQAARALRDNILIDQNRDGLTPYSIAYAYAATPVKSPALIQKRWTNRIDVTLTFRRQITEVYNVLSFLTADGVLISDAHDLPEGTQFPFDTANHK